MYDVEARLVLKGIDDGATDTVRIAKDEVDGLTAAQNANAKAIDTQNIAFIQQAMALNQVAGGMDMVTGSVVQLNWVSEEQQELLRNITAGMKLFIGTAQMIQGVIGLINALKASEAALAAVQAFKTALIPFLGPILVAAALATAAVAAVTLSSYQTSPGEFKTVRETGPAMVHEGEIIGRPKKGIGGGINVTINAGALDIGSYSQRRNLAKMIAGEVSI